MDHLDQTYVLYIASFIGSIAFALSGYLLGARRHLDIMGVFIIAFLTANGGGVIRDVLVGREPAILASTQPFWLTAGVVLLASLLKLQKFDGLERHTFFVACDAVGLVAFGITGTLIGLEEGVHFFGILTLALLTATGGGIIRDLLVNEVPEVLHTGFFGSVVLLLAVALYVLNLASLLTPLSLLIVALAALAMRLVAYRDSWQLPKL